MPNVLLGCTGSVAALKLPLLVNELLKLKLFGVDINIRVIVTEHSTHFFSVEEIPNHVRLYKDEDEWTSWTKRGDPVLHIDLSKWADLFLIAPLDANTLGKIANGLCDNLLTCAARAWDPKKLFLFCPAMNTKMWEHPITDVQIQILRNWGYKMIPCVAKTLICGDTGLGAMAEVVDIVHTIHEIIKIST